MALCSADAVAVAVGRCVHNGGGERITSEKNGQREVYFRHDKLHTIKQYGASSSFIVGRFYLRSPD